LLYELQAILWEADVLTLISLFCGYFPCQSWSVLRIAKRDWRGPIRWSQTGCFEDKKWETQVAEKG